jgi:hypothetical protein
MSGAMLAARLLAAPLRAWVRLAGRAWPASPAGASWPRPA